MNRREESMRTNVRRLVPAVALLGTVIGSSLPSEAGIQTFVIDQTATVSLNPHPLNSSTPVTNAISYTVYQGLIFGVLDPNDPHNTIITDINLAPTTGGKVGYIANFQIVTPTNSTDRSGLLIYEVSHRGGNAIPAALIQGATYVQSGWQGDLLSECSLPGPTPTSTPYPCINLNAGPYGSLNANASSTAFTFTPPKVPGIIAGTTNLTSYVIQVPVATQDGKPLKSDGSNAITGPVYSHVAPKTSGPTAQ